MVLERHHSRRICLMLLALDTPKLWDRFSLGLESTGLGRLYISRSGARIHERVSVLKLVSTIIPMQPECSIYLLLASESSLSKIDRRAWAPMLRGRVCDLTSSRLLSPTCPKDLSLLTSPSLQDGSTEGSDNAKHISPILKYVTGHLSLTCHAAVALNRSQTWQGLSLLSLQKTTNSQSKLYPWCCGLKQGSMCVGKHGSPWRRGDPRALIGVGVHVEDTNRKQKRKL